MDGSRSLKVMTKPRKWSRGAYLKPYRSQSPIFSGSAWNIKTKFRESKSSTPLLSIDGLPKRVDGMGGSMILFAEAVAMLV